MSYRDDLEAALARVAALEEELRRVHGDDAERIAALEAQLVAAKQRATQAATPPPPSARKPEKKGAWQPIVGIVAFFAVAGTVLSFPLRDSCQDERRYEAIVTHADYKFALADARRRSAEAGYESVALRSVTVEGVSEAGVPQLRGRNTLRFQFCPSLKASCGNEIDYHEKVRGLRSSTWTGLRSSSHCGACSANHSEPHCSFAEVRRRMRDTGILAKWATLTWENADPPYWNVVPHEKEYRIVKMPDDCR